MTRGRLQPLRETQELERIRALPRRDVSEADAMAWAAVLTPLFTRTASAAAGWGLNSKQALALAESKEYGGAYLGYPVGTGKTLIYELAPAMHEAERPVLIIDGGDGARAKTFKDRAHYAQHFRLRQPPPRVVTFRELTMAGNQYLLDQLNPDLLMIDECDMFANPDSAPTVRVDRWVQDHWDVPVIAGTGTPGRKSLLDDWHILVWCLKDRCPLPLDAAEVQRWARALDEHSGPRPDCGVLGGSLQHAREWYRLRLAQTPGVILLDFDSAADVPLRVSTVYAPDDAKLDEHFEALRIKGVSPDDEPISDPLSEWRIEAYLGSGLYQYLDPPPPIEWRDARRLTAGFVRTMCGASRNWSKPLDTEGQVLRHFKDHKIVQAWDAIKPTYDPKKHQKIRWISDSALKACMAWLDESDGVPSIVWCGSVEFALRLGRMTGLSVYGPNGADANKRLLINAPEDQHMIVRWHANKRMYNLQPWRRNLIAQPPQSGKYLEQIIGRAHRQGADQEVSFEILLTSGLMLDLVQTVQREGGINRALRSMTHKVTRVGITIGEAPPGYRWSTAKLDYDPAEYGIQPRRTLARRS
jgi:hypothetical protein